MEESFYVKLAAYMETLNRKKQDKYLIKRETYNQVVLILKGTEDKIQAQFKFWAKKRFHLMKIGDQEILYSSKEKLPVVTFEELFEKINDCHTAVGHLGSKICNRNLKQNVFLHFVNTSKVYMYTLFLSAKCTKVY